MKLPFKKISKLNKAFTLVETLVAISIFTISVLAVMAILSKSISDTGYVKKKVIATYLAQEGIEYMRNMRDTYMLYSGSADAGWTAFNNKLVGSSCQNPNGCYFNADNLFSYPPAMAMTQIILTACSSPTSVSICPNGPLYYESSTGKYNYTSGTDSGFARKIRAIVSANEIKISSTVSWTQGSGFYSITFSENLFNWIEQ